MENSEKIQEDLRVLRQLVDTKTVQVEPNEDAIFEIDTDVVSIVLARHKSGDRTVRLMTKDASHLGMSGCALTFADTLRIKEAAVVVCDETGNESHRTIMARQHLPKFVAALTINVVEEATLSNS